MGNRFELRCAKIALKNNLLGVLKSSPEEIQENKALIRMFVTGKDRLGNPVRVDPRTQYLAAKLALQLTADIDMHLNPATQKSEVEIKGLKEPPRELRVRILGSGDKENKDEKETVKRSGRRRRDAAR
jgi:hypothetical protein